MDYSKIVLPILREMRDLLLKNWGHSEAIYQKEKSAATVVTELDIKVEELASKKLAKIYPEITFVGEESGGDRTSERFWLMDPIDGTNHFMRGLPFCTSMIALIEKGQVTFSAIYDFINDQMYWAQKGQGAFVDSTKIQVSSRPLAGAYICWETHLDKEENRKIFYALQQKALLMKTISAGWEFAMVALGKLEARVMFDPHGKDYDFAPGSLLVSEAGGIVTNLGSEKYDYRNTDVIVANPVVYRELTEGTDAIFPVV